jgi:hypothetical protein
MRNAAKSDDPRTSWLARTNPGGLLLHWGSAMDLGRRLAGGAPEDTVSG